MDIGGCHGTKVHYLTRGARHRVPYTGDSMLPVIAIVEDDASVRESLRLLVQSAGYASMTFGSAQEFLAWLPKGRAACLLLNVPRNSMGAFALQEKLAVPVVFITSHDDAETRVRIEKSGAAGHLWKPFDEDALLNAIRRALGQNDKTWPIARQI
jgi:FixJ family two-component response regulator